MNESQKNRRPLRRTKKEVTDRDRVEAFLKTARIGYLGLYDAEGTYVVPLNYTWLNGNIYFHGSEAGRKYDALRQEMTVCFTVAEEYGTIPRPVPGDTGTAYFSVMVFGKTAIVAELDEAAGAMQSMLDKYAPGYYENRLAPGHVAKYRSSTGSSTVVYRLTPHSITAKADEVPGDRLFFPGRKQRDDLKRPPCVLPDCFLNKN
jgi:hypothetical protein